MKAGTTELLKFVKLQRRLGESRRGIIGLLEGLWLSTAKNCPTGDIGRFTNEEIAIMVDWEGDPDLLVDSLIECGWLDVCSDHRLIVHDWSDHCPQYVRGNLKKHGREIIAEPTKQPPKEPTKQPPKEPAKQPPKEPAKQPTMDGATKPSLAKPNQAKPIQEDSSVVDEPRTEPPPVMIFECSGIDRTWELTHSQLTEWSDAYPAMDVLAECRKAKAWLSVHPKKTASGMPRFLVKWLNRAADSLKTNYLPASQPKPATVKAEGAII
jgi:hypothetical protein